MSFFRELEMKWLWLDLFGWKATELYIYNKIVVVKLYHLIYATILLESMHTTSDTKVLVE